jgi:hypothetical protein
MPDLSLTIALERYDRHVPFFMRTVQVPSGLMLRPLEVGMSHPCRDGMRRHERFLQNNEFDIAETSLSSTPLRPAAVHLSSASRPFRAAYSARTTSSSMLRPASTNRRI